MASLLNPNRPPAFCPGCSHEQSLHALDRALLELGLQAHEIAIVSDIGCSGLFDTFFNTHALHGLHGRALTYAAGIKLARPELTVVATMGDGGIGIGGAHFLAACRRNLNLTLLVLNNFNFGMTGGQFSCTTPSRASTASGFLNTLEPPLDLCQIAAAAGAPFVARGSVHEKDLSRLLASAIAFDGFAVVDLWGLCTGHYRRRNPLTPADLRRSLDELPPFSGPVIANQRPEYGGCYRGLLEVSKSAPQPTKIAGEEIPARFAPPVRGRREVVLLGAAGDRIISTGLLLAQAAILGGMQVTQKNDYDITVMRGPSVSELILSPEPILFTGVERPDVMVALAPEGVARRRELFARMSPEGRIVLAKGVKIPDTAARVNEIDFKGHGVKRTQRALAALSLLARTRDPLTVEMLEGALQISLSGEALDAGLALLAQTAAIPSGDRQCAS